LLLLLIRFAVIPCFVTGERSFLRLVLMPAGTFVHAATLRFVFVCFIRAWLRITTSTMTTVPAVPEQVHADKEDKNQNPEPICCKPRHGTFLLLVHSQKPL